MADKMDYLGELQTNKDIFLKFMSERYKIFTHSNLFLRDIQFAIKFYFERKNKSLKYPEAEKLAFQFTDFLVQQSDLSIIDSRTWKVLFSFDHPVVEKETLKNAEV